MKTRNRNYSLQQCVASASTTKSVIGTLLVFLLVLCSPSPVFPFKAGHVEQVPGSSVARKGVPANTGNTGSSRHTILQKLAGSRREIGAQTGYDSSSAQVGYYGQSQSMESHEEQQMNPPYVRFPTLTSPFSSGVTSRPSVTVTKSGERRHQNRQRIHRLHKVTSTEPSASDLLAHEEPSSLFRSSTEGFDSTAYYMTGSDAKMSSIDAERYSQETDLYEKQTATSIKSLVNASRASSSSPSPPPSSSLSASEPASAAADKEKSTNKKKKSNLSNNNSSSKTNHNANNPVAVVPTLSLSKPTLLPPHYLSLATFRHIDGTIEKSSGNIIGRIANFWKNMSNNNIRANNATVTPTNNNSNKDDADEEEDISSNRSSNYKENNSSSNNNNNNNSNGSGRARTRSHTTSKKIQNNVYTKLASDSSSIDLDENETDNVSLRHNNNNHDHDNHNNSSQSHRQSYQPIIRNNVMNRVRSESNANTRSSSMQPSKFISLEDTSERNFVDAKQHYFSLDDGEDDDLMIGGSSLNTADADKKYKDDLVDLRHHSSVEDYLTSETSTGDIDNLSTGSHSFHEDLFHPTGTITAIISNDQQKDLSSAGSTTNSKSILKSIPSGPSASSSTTTLTAPGVITRSDVKRAQSDKIWSLDSHFNRNELMQSEEDEDDYYLKMTYAGFLKRELWTIPVLVLAILDMALIIIFEVYVLCHARGQSRRHLFLGQMLLFGLFLCSFLALMFAVHPSIIGCYVGRFGLGITYCLIFSVLMVKCVFLLSLDTGVYLPTSYQGILLFFAVAVQVAINTQWSIMYPPFLQTVESGSSINLQCGTSFVQLLYSLSYVGFLILMVGFLAGRAAYKGVVENYRESVYILITAVVTVPIALSWTVAGWMLQGRHLDACISFGLIAHSLTTFLIIFMPKGRQLASLDKEAVCFEDQEDQCSGYSPSFFHFKPTTKNYKPALWGDGNLYTTLEPTVSTINPNVFFHRNDFHSGMIY